QVKYVCDLDAEKLVPLASRYPTLITTRDFQEVLRDSTIDGVVIATPVSTHRRLATEALCAGKHVLVEKPLAGDRQSALEIADVAVITLEFANKVMAHIHVSWMSPAKLRRTTVVGSKQMIVYDDLEAAEKVKLYDSGVERLALNAATRAELQRTYRVGDVLS